MMSLTAYNKYCGGLAQSTHVVQWRGSHVWKVGGKVFAIASPTGDEAFAITFKCTPLGYEMLKEQAGLRPAPYLASRGFSWIQMYEVPGLTDEELKAYLAGSYDLVVAGLTKAARAKLGLS